MDPIDYFVQGQVRAGLEIRFRRAVHDALALARQESAALDYRWSLDAARRRCALHARYSDQDGLLDHLDRMHESILPRILESVRVEAVSVFSPLHGHARRFFEQHDATFYGPVATVPVLDVDPIMA